MGQFWIPEPLCHICMETHMEPCLSEQRLHLKYRTISCKNAVAEIRRC